MSLLPFSKATFANPTGEMDMFGLSDPYAMTEFGGWPTNAGAWNRQIGQHNLQMDVVEMGDSFKVYADVPGAKIDDVELSIENGMLGVKVTRNETREKDMGVQHRIERFVGEWRRMIKIPKNADFNQAAAKLNDGVLTITFPKFDNDTVSTKRMVPINR